MVVMADQPLDQRQLYELDKLVHNGVHVIFAAQMYNYQVQYMGPGQFDLRGMPTRVNLNDLVKNYGFDFDTKMFMDTKPVMIRVNGENINNKLSISNKISELFYLYGTRLDLFPEILKEDTLTTKILFTSGNESWTRDGSGYGPGPRMKRVKINRKKSRNPPNWLEKESRTRSSPSVARTCSRVTCCNHCRATRRFFATPWMRSHLGTT